MHRNGRSEVSIIATSSGLGSSYTPCTFSTPGETKQGKWGAAVPRLVEGTGVRVCLYVRLCICMCVRASYRRVEKGAQPRFTNRIPPIPFRLLAAVGIHSTALYCGKNARTVPFLRVETPETSSGAAFSKTQYSTRVAGPSSSSRQ